MEPQWGGGHFLVSDAEREHAVEALKQSFQAGRITADELSDRIGHALSARTAADLDRTMTGLPWARPGSPMIPNISGYGSYPAPAARRQHELGLITLVLGIFGFLCGITAIPAVVLGVVALTMGAEREDKGFAIAGTALGIIWSVVIGWWLLS
ncbi:DUF1707 and DUF4190 domain-containing protein [Nocardia carnea]|uniref:DUF1707 and DUF4190 domain-containing protein n=1 Tax=Nocardia carnea TaxID=37328 RepID=UPI002453A515|nr:DUF1707 and DUF4190 domain-containing protein [Nocardia carnea]